MREYPRGNSVCINPQPYSQPKQNELRNGCGAIRQYLHQRHFRSLVSNSDVVEIEETAYIVADEEQLHDNHGDAGGDNQNPCQPATETGNVSFCHDNSRDNIGKLTKQILRSADMIWWNFSQMFIGLRRQTPALWRSGQESHFQ